MNIYRTPQEPRPCSQCGNLHAVQAGDLSTLLWEIGVEGKPGLALCLIDGIERVQRLKPELAKARRDITDAWANQASLAQRHDALLKAARGLHGCAMLLTEYLDKDEQAMRDTQKAIAAFDALVACFIIVRGQLVEN